MKTATSWKILDKVDPIRNSEDSGVDFCGKIIILFSSFSVFPPEADF